MRKENKYKRRIGERRGRARKRKEGGRNKNKLTPMQGPHEEGKEMQKKDSGRRRRRRKTRRKGQKWDTEHGKGRRE